jgi:TonB family protein
MLFWIWMAGVAAASMASFAGIGKILWLVLGSKRVTCTELVDAQKAVACSMGLSRTVRLLQNDQGVLGTCGVFRPTILIPSDANGWTEDRIRIVLTHEFAHIKRFDWFAQILAEVARSIYWFNPLFWIASRWLRTESEHACDDAVLNAGFDPKDYAWHLLDVARTLGRSTRAWAAVLSMSRPPNLERRFLAMLNPAVNHRALTWAAILGIAVVAIFITLPLSAMQIVQHTVTEPALVATSTSAPPPKTVEAPAVAPEKPVGRSTSTKPAAIPAAPVQAPVSISLTSLAGSVYDPTGAVVPGVAVTLTAIDGTAAVTRTDETGRYQFSQLAAGSYMLQAQLPGFASSARRMDLPPNGATRQNIFLSVGNISQEVVVRTTGQPRPAQATAPQRIRVGGNVQAAKLTSQVTPVYPASARDAGIQGSVILQGIIGTDGTLLGLRVVTAADPALASAAMEAVRQWRYLPTLLNGEPVEVVTDISVAFAFQ